MFYKHKGRYVTFIKIRKTRDIYHCPYEVLQVSMTLTGSLENKQIDGVFKSPSTSLDYDPPILLFPKLLKMKDFLMKPIVPVYQNRWCFVDFANFNPVLTPFGYLSKLSKCSILAYLMLKN